MVAYSCEKCGKSFKQKGHYTKHLQRKTPCNNIKDNIEKIVDNKINKAVKVVEEKIIKLNKIELNLSCFIAVNIL